MAKSLIRWRVLQHMQQVELTYAEERIVYVPGYQLGTGIDVTVPVMRVTTTTERHMYWSDGERDDMIAAAEAALKC